MHRRKSSKKISGHVPKEISRSIKFLITRGTIMYAEISSSKNKRSSLVQRALERSSQPTRQSWINVCLNILDQVEVTLIYVQNVTKYDGFSTLHNINTTSVSDVERTLYNVDTTLSRHCFNVASALVKSISKPIGLLISTDL